MDDLDKFVHRGSGSIARLNEPQCFRVELHANDVAADRDE